MEKTLPIEKVKHFRLTSESPLNALFTSDEPITLPHDLICPMYAKNSRYCGLQEITLESADDCGMEEGNYVVQVFVKRKQGEPALMLLGDRNSHGTFNLHIATPEPPKNPPTDPQPPTPPARPYKRFRW